MTIKKGYCNFKKVIETSFLNKAVNSEQVHKKVWTFLAASL